MLTLGSTFTQFHVEDYALQNICTLQRIHKKGSDAFKIWFITTDPTKGQALRRAQYHTMCLDVIQGAEFVLVQQKGQTIYVPPLAYHAVLTVYSTSVSSNDQYVLLCGTFFADLRAKSIWRESISLWMNNHQTGYRHGSSQCLLEKYVKFATNQTSTKRPSKKQKRKEKASEAAIMRWKI
jgi:hypothetical protein